MAIFARWMSFWGRTFNFVHLFCICFRVPLLIPFKGNVTEMMIPILMPAVNLLNQKLSKWKAQQMPKPSDVWDILRLELALEKFTWGRIHWNQMNRAGFYELRRTSVQLGPGHNAPSDCQTDQLGFLALNNQMPIGTNMPLPPIGTWTHNWMQVNSLYYKNNTLGQLTSCPS